MKLFMIAQLLLTILGSLVLLEIRDGGAAASFAIGSGLIFLNVVTLAFVWFYVIQKKLIALSFMIIVFKYAILGAIIYKLLSYEWLSKGWLCVGLGTLVMTTLIYGIFSPKKDDENG